MQIYEIIVTRRVERELKMTNLSVNINKVATIRNARGGNNPDVCQVAIDCEAFGADGITVHPRPDERHIRYQDVRDLKPLLKTEFNIEGYPQRSFIDLVTSVCPTQVTLVPDAPAQITSKHGWNTKMNLEMLTDIVAEFKEKDIRVSIFVDANPEMVEYAARIGADRVELYTEPYATYYQRNPEVAIRRYYLRQIPFTDEVSIGHALICDALYLGLKETIKQYKELCKN